MMAPDDGQQTDRARSTIFSSTRFRCLLLFLALPFLLGAKNQGVKEHVVCRDGFLEIVSAESISIKDCRRLAKTTIDAWNFDMKQMNWRTWKNKNRKLKLRLLSVKTMEAKHPNTYAFAVSTGDLIVTSTAVLHGRPASVGTLAHELGHIQAYRVTGSKRSGKVPAYYWEGHGISMGQSYLKMLGITTPKLNAERTRIVAKLTTGEARLILTTNRAYFKGNSQKLFRMEAFGFFFAEYLRVRKGMPIARMGRVFEQVGHGWTYRQAFKQVYGITINQAISDVIAFMERTKSNPSERFRGTLLEKEPL